MKDFNIAKYLRENSLGSHAILGAYVDLHALKEEEVGNNKPVSKVPYDGAEEKLDGFGDEFDQVDPVEEDFSYDDDTDDVNPFPSLNRGGYSDEQDKFDRMMGLSHEYIGKVSPVVKKTIDALRADGFDDQDIIDFLATDLSNLEEEVTVSSSGVEMEEGLDNEHGNVYRDLDIIAKKIKKAGAMLQYDEFGDSIIVMVTTKDGDSQLQKAIYKEVKQLIKKNHPAFVVSPIEKDSPGRISFSVDYFPTNMEESLEEAEMYTVDFGTNTQDFELDRDRNVLIGLKPQMGLPGSSPREQDIIPVMIDANGYLSTKDPRVKDISPASNASPFTDPGYMNRD